jgi:hypothetical protein
MVALEAEEKVLKGLGKDSSRRITIRALNILIGMVTSLVPELE